VSVNGCSQLVANVSIGTTAALGDVDVEVINPDQVFGAGTALFSVTPDSAPPSIFSVQAVNVGSTAATISWSTDKPADSQVFYRRAGESVYQQTSLDAALVTQHQIDLTGLSPDSTYEYHVRSADSAGNVSTSSPDQTFDTSSIAYSYLRIEAESGALEWPVISTQGSGAFRGAWIDTPRSTHQGNANNPAGTADLGFNLPNSGSWHFWYRIYGPGTNHNSWYEELDGGGMSYFTTTQSRVWQWISGRSYSLDAGLHTLTLGGRESQARVDRVLITDDPGFVPTEQPGADVTPPAQVSALDAAQFDRVNGLSWNNPGSADLDRVVVRFRTDGSHPRTPVDGFPVFDQPATRSVAQSLNHSGLNNNTTYFYSVFAIDSEGNASNPSTIQSTPDANAPSVGQVQATQRTDSSTPAVPCVRHDCSNDVDWSGADNGNPAVLGDESLVWQPFVAWERKTCGDDPQQPCTTNSNERCYEIASHPDLTTITRLCEATFWSPTAEKWRYIQPSTSFVPYAMGAEHFPQIGLPHRYVIRACAGTSCSDWAPKTSQGGQDYAEFVGMEYACFGSENRNRCEKSCYSGAPKMFPEIPDCSDPD
jgi:chitodextrinase